VIGSVGAVARGLIDKDFIEKRREACVFCGLCARVCPTGALEVRIAGKAEKDDSYLHVALKTTQVNGNCVHCGLCAEVCPQRCIEVKERQLAKDGSLRLEGKTLIVKPLRSLRLVRCGLTCGAITFEALAGEFFRDDNICQSAGPAFTLARPTPSSTKSGTGRDV
jgi:4Fe-4S ferredoxin